MVYLMDEQLPRGAQEINLHKKKGRRQPFFLMQKNRFELEH